MSEPREVIDDEGLRCPYCNALRTEDIEDYIDYWSRDSPQFATCGECGKQFAVHEIVDRKWRSVAIEEVTDGE